MHVYQCLCVHPTKALFDIFLFKSLSGKVKFEARSPVAEPGAQALPV